MSKRPTGPSQVNTRKTRKRRCPHCKATDSLTLVGDAARLLAGKGLEMVCSNCGQHHIAR